MEIQKIKLKLLNRMKLLNNLFGTEINWVETNDQ